MAKKKSKKLATVVSDVKPSSLGKSNKRTIVIAVIAVLVVIALLVIFKSGGKPEEVKTDREAVIEKLDIADVTCIYLGDTPKYGYLGKYFGNIENDQAQGAENVVIKVEFFDANGRSVGTHSTTIVGGNIEPGKTRPFFSYTEEGTLSGEFTTCKAKLS